MLTNQRISSCVHLLRRRAICYMQLNKTWRSISKSTYQLETRVWSPIFRPTVVSDCRASVEITLKLTLQNSIDGQISNAM